MEADFNYIQGRTRVYAASAGNSISKELTIFPHRVDEVQLLEVNRTPPLELSKYRTGNFIDLFNQNCLIPTSKTSYKRTMAERVVCFDLNLVHEAETDGIRYFEYEGRYVARIKKRPKAELEKKIEPVKARVIAVPESVRKYNPFKDRVNVDAEDKPAKSSGCFDGASFSFNWFWRLASIALLWYSAAASGYTPWFTILAVLLGCGLILTLFSNTQRTHGSGWLFPIGMAALGIGLGNWPGSVLISIILATVLLYFIYSGNRLVRFAVSSLSILYFINVLFGLNTDAWKAWKEDYVQVEDKDKLPEQDRTIIVDSTDVEGDPRQRELIEHHLNWKDNFRKGYSGTYRVYADDAGKAQFERNRFSIDLSTTAGWSKLYRKLNVVDDAAVSLLVKEFNRIKQKKSLNRRETLEMVVTSVQSIPYYLVHESSCSTVSSRDQFSAEYHESGRPCLPSIKHGLQSPSEFAEDLKGDCDTRTLFLYQVLSKMGYDVAVLISFQYGHAMLGVNMPTKGEYVRHRGKRFYLWETTAKNWKLGQVPPNYNNLRYWNIALN